MLLVIIPGFGAPNLSEKLAILRKNLKILENAIVHIFCYGCISDIPTDLLKDITWHFEKGIIGYFLHKYVTPNFVNNINPSKLMILLDDVELDSTIKLSEINDVMSSHNLDLISPSLSKREMSYWDFMITQPKLLFARIMPVIELFCYIFTKDAYVSKYYRHIDPDNPWMWGMDFLIKSHFGIRGALLNNTLMHHHFSNSCYTKDLNDPRKDSDNYLKKYDTSWSIIHSRGIILSHDDLIY